MTYLDLLTKLNVLLDGHEEISQFDEINWPLLLATNIEDQGLKKS